MSLRRLQVPVFSLFKRYDHSGDLTTASGAGQQEVTTDHTELAATGQPRSGEKVEERYPFPDRDILLPNFSQTYDKLYMYPWNAKRNAALLRGSIQVVVWICVQLII